jgi:hypothetical protein
MPVWQAILDAIGQFIGKVIAVGGVGILAAAGTAALTAILEFVQVTPNVTIYAVVVVGALVVWQKGIVPLVEALIAGVNTKSTAVRESSNSAGQYLKFGNW